MVILITLSIIVAECQQQWYSNNYDPHQRIQLDLTGPFNSLFNPFNTFPNQNLFPGNPYFPQYFNQNTEPTPNGFHNFPMNGVSHEKPVEGQNQPPDSSESTLRGSFTDLPQSHGPIFNEDFLKPEPDTKLPGTKIPEVSGENNDADEAAERVESEPPRASDDDVYVDTSGDQDRSNLHNTNKPNMTKNSDYLLIPVTTADTNQLNPAGVLVNKNFAGPVVANADAVQTTDNLTPTVGTANTAASTFTTIPGTLSQGVTYIQPGSQYVNLVPQTPGAQANLVPVNILPNNIAVNGDVGSQPNVYSLLTNPSSAVPQSTGGSAPNTVYYVVYPPQNQATSAGYQVPNSSPILVPLNNQPNNVLMINNQPYMLVPLNTQFNNLADFTNQPNNLVGFDNRPVSLNNQPYTSASSNNPPNNLVKLNNPANLVPLNNQPYNFVTLSNQPSNLVSSNQPVTYVPLTSSNAPVLYSLKDKYESSN